MENSNKKQNRDDFKTSHKREDLPYNPNVTEHDKDILRQDNIHGDGGDDQQLRDRKEKVDFAGEELDIPGRKSGRRSDHPALKDEENQLYSQGGPDNENLEQDKPL